MGIQLRKTYFAAIVTIFALFLLTGMAIAEEISVDLSENDWQFTTGDDLGYSKVDFNDKSWDKVSAPIKWEQSGYRDYNGFAWYRQNFKVSEALLKQKLVVLLGKIGNADQTFINGVKVGETGAFPPNYQGAEKKERAYDIPEGLLKTENMIAVRVYNGKGDGGILDGIVGITTKEEYEATKYHNTHPHTSFNNLPTSNGYAAAVYDTGMHQIIGLYDHIYRYPAENKKTSNFLNSAYFVVKVDGKTYDLSTIPEKSINYIPGTGIIHTTYAFGFEAFYLVPMHVNTKTLVMVGKFTKDFKSSEIKVQYDKAIGTPANVALKVIEKEARNAQGRVTEKSVVFDLVTPTKTKDNKNNSVISENQKILDNEIAWWNKWQSKSKIPSVLGGEKRELFIHSLAVLKMAQCRESGKSYGQILASLPPGEWNIAWVRDGAYAIAALAKTGHLEEAKAALEFMLKADSSTYKNYRHIDGKNYGIGKPYQISVCRYFGNGKEESDFNEDGPNIELDGFGMFIWALHIYTEESGDKAFLKKYWDVVSKKVADVLVTSIDKTGLIRVDSGSWERHLPGKHFTYTSVFAAQGLKSAAELARSLGQSQKGESYQKAYENLKKAINEKLVDENRTLKGSLEGNNPDEYEYYDAGAVEAFNFGIIDPASDIAKNTIKAFEDYLKIAARDNGYFRVSNATNNWYDRQEWIVLDLRIVTALRSIGEAGKANDLLDWVAGQSTSNYNMIAELYDESTADYAGAVPMCGFGAGAYILTFEGNLK